MAWQIKFANPAKPGLFYDGGYATLSEFAISRRTKSLRAMFTVFADADAYAAWKSSPSSVAPLGDFALELSAVKRVVQQQINSPKDGSVAFPEITAPAFDDFMAALPSVDGAKSLYDVIARALYGLSKTMILPFADAQAV